MVGLGCEHREESQVLLVEACAEAVDLLPSTANAARGSGGHRPASGKKQKSKKIYPELNNPNLNNDLLGTSQLN
jgi:hypothetical protein